MRRQGEESSVINRLSQEPLVGLRKSCEPDGREAAIKDASPSGPPSEAPRPPPGPIPFTRRATRGAAARARVFPAKGATATLEQIPAMSS